MRKLLFITSLFCLSSCATMSQLNTQMENANELMAENIQSMAQSRVIIEENTRQIEKSTNAMRSFQFVFPVFFSMLLLLFIYILFKLSHSAVRKHR